VRLWVRAFWAERDLPCGVRGPVDLAAFRRLRAARSASVVSCPWSVVEERADGALVVSAAGTAMLDMKSPRVRTLPPEL